MPLPIGSSGRSRAVTVARAPSGSRRTSTVAVAASRPRPTRSSSSARARPAWVVPSSTAARRAASWAAPSTTCWAFHHSPNCNPPSTMTMNNQATSTNSIMVTPRSSARRRRPSQLTGGPPGQPPLTVLVNSSNLPATAPKKPLSAANTTTATTATMRMYSTEVTPSWRRWSGASWTGASGWSRRAWIGWDDLVRVASAVGQAQQGDACGPEDHQQERGEDQRGHGHDHGDLGAFAGLQQPQTAPLPGGMGLRSEGLEHRGALACACLEGAGEGGQLGQVDLLGHGADGVHALLAL